MPATTAQKRAAFAALHQAGCFVLPNPFDVGGAIALERLGFSAIASTSAGMAWSMGRADNHADLERALDHLATMAAAVDIPLNADFEGGFAVAPAAVATNVTRAVASGVAGLSIEDSSGDPAAPLIDFSLAVERVAAAAQAIEAAGGGVVLTARSEGFIAGRPELDETVRRLVAFAEAGAGCLYAPGLRSEADIAEVVRAVAPKPVNVLTLGQSVETLARLGVRRISVGGSLARVAGAGRVGRVPGRGAGNPRARDVRGLRRRRARRRTQRSLRRPGLASRGKSRLGARAGALSPAPGLRDGPGRWWRRRT